MARFVKEYASDKIKRLESNDLMQDKYKQESIAKIRKAEKLFNQCMLSADEAMRIISES